MAFLFGNPEVAKLLGYRELTSPGNPTIKKGFRRGIHPTYRRSKSLKPFTAQKKINAPPRSTYPSGSLFFPWVGALQAVVLALLLAWLRPPELFLADLLVQTCTCCQQFLEHIPIEIFKIESDSVTRIETTTLPIREIISLLIIFSG